MRNIQGRVIEAPLGVVGALLDRLSGSDDPLWPSPAWPPLRLDRALSTGAGGGHGPIRYRVSGYEPRRRVRFTFDDAIGLSGFHEFRVEPIDARRCRLVHDLSATTHGRMIAGWPLAVRWLHEALIQDLLDNAQRVATGAGSRPRRHSPWVRFLRYGVAAVRRRRSPHR